MAAEGGEKTEPATPRRRMEARAKGQVARSQDLVAALLLLGALLALASLGPTLFNGMLLILEGSLHWDLPADPGEVTVLAGAVAVQAAKQVAPFLVILVIVTLTSLFLQVGWLFTTHPLTPNLSRLDPIQGFKRLFSARSVASISTNMVKVIIVCLVAYLTVRADIPALIHVLSMDISAWIPLCASLIFKLGIRCALVLLVLALVDLWWQRYRFERELRMTKEEVKDELRSMEGDPVVKRRQRQLQMKLAGQRLRQEVPKADVVITNPTHFAIAIAYNVGRMPAPKVVAKGVDELALRIREIANELGIPIVERRSLAQALYYSVDIGRYIPEQFYKAIAEILAYVYELTGASPLKRKKQQASRVRSPMMQSVEGQPARPN